MAHPVSLNRRFTASSLDDAASPLSPLGSNPFSFHRRSHTGVEQRHRVGRPAERPNSDFQFQNSRSNLYAGDLHDTMLMGERIRARRARDDVAALIDFLKNHPPPPDNFMSIPYDGDDEDGRGRWSKIKKMGRRSKSMPRPQQHMRLPDSAVAGVTTGGHRHIAISIPLEATPYGEEMRSQYPVFTHDMQMGTPSKEQVRTFRNEKGVVTVLRPVTEVYESDGASVISKGRSPYTNSQGHRPPPLPPHKPTNSLSGQNNDYYGILPSGFDTPLLDDSSAPWHISRTPSRGDGSIRKPNSSSAFHRSAYPARASSMAANPSVKHPPSIDGLLSPQDQAVGGLNGVRSTSPARHRAQSAGNNAVQETIKDPQRLQPEVDYDRDVTQGANRNGSQTRNTTLIADSPLLSHTEGSRPTTAGSTRSRKDIVKEKKRRDMEAAKRSAKLKAHQKKDASRALHRPSTAHPSSQPSADESDKSRTSQPGQLNLTLSNLMVVMDVEPCTAEDKHLPVRPKTAPSKASPEQRPESPIPSITVNSPSIPTPPTSTQGSPPQRHSASDRTSLTRRREWKAIREQERKARDAMAVARAKAQQLASGGVTYEKGAVTQADKEVMRLYEAYREHRLRDMERRLRRLERNGDVWLQALVPVLNNMNKTMEAANEQPLEDIRDWASDGETSGTAERINRNVQKKRLTRRASLSQGRLLEKLTGQRYDDDTWSDSVSRSDDASGLGTIEPLMRELAGQTVQWQGTTQSPVVTNGGQFHPMRN